MAEQYYITARALCHDIRLNAEVSVTVWAETMPTKAEAESLLFEKAEEAYADQGGYWFEFYDLEIKQVPSEASSA